MKTLLFSALLFSATLFADFSSIPDEIYVTQRICASQLTFDIATKEEKIGTVQRKMWCCQHEYDFYDNEGCFQAKAVRLLSELGVVFDITDDQGSICGHVKECFCTSLPTFHILSANKTLLAIAKINFWGTQYTVYDPITNTEIATLSRSTCRTKENWTAKITNYELFATKEIDPKLFITVMAFQTDYDNWKSEIETKKPDQDLSIICYLQAYELLEPSEEDFMAVTALGECNVNDLLDSPSLTPFQKKAVCLLLKR